MATKNQVDIFRELSHIWMKIIITIIVVGCYVAVLVFIMYLIVSDKPWENVALITGFEAILTFCMPQLMKHYFPNRET